MRLIRPMTVNDAALSSSNVVETDYTAWASGTTYAQGTRVRVVSTNVHKVFESVQGSNTNHNPLTDDGTWWLLVGATDRWRMFDGSVNSQTSNADSIDVQILGAGRIDAVALLNISAATARIKVTDPVDGVVYDTTFSLNSSSGITDWYSYFFEPIARAADLVVTDLPHYSDPTVEIVLTDTGATVLCGECVLGQQRTFGETQYGASVGIQDYSIKQADDFGNFTIVERSFSKRANFTVNIDAGLVDQLQTLLAAYRATPIVYVGSDLYGATAVYGFYKDFQIEITYPEVSVVTIEIEGLT